jgi:hypothetical protein
MAVTFRPILSLSVRTTARYDPVFPQLAHPAQAA